MACGGVESCLSSTTGYGALEDSLTAKLQAYYNIEARTSLASRDSWRPTTA